MQSLPKMLPERCYVVGQQHHSSKNNFKREDVITILQKMNNAFIFYSWSVKVQEMNSANTNYLNDDVKQHLN